MKNRIIEMVCNKWGLTLEDALSNKRKQPLPLVRAMIAKFLRNKTKLTTTAIGKMINRDHATVLYYLTIYDTEYRFNETFRKFADEINKDLQYQTPFISELEEEFNEIRSDVE